MLKITIDAKVKQKKPANAVVVNFGVSFRHLNVTENTAKPIEDVMPKTNPIKDASDVLPTAIIPMPIVAINIDIQTFKEIVSFKNKKASKAVKNGIAARQVK